MTARRSDTILRHIRRAVLAPDGAGLTDSKLLECYVDRRDETAFEALLRRHGPMVLGVCRRVLGNVADAEDAFQATFLVLVSKAATVLPRDRVGAWLYGVAHHTALKAKASAAKRRSKERQAGAMQGSESRHEMEQKLLERLDQELLRLPDKYRVPIVLCDLEGRTRKEVARQLGWAEGTVASRLSRGRALLARRMKSHGLSLSDEALGLVFASQGVPACPPYLAASTLNAAAAFAAGSAAAGVIPAQVVALTKGALKAMLLSKLKVAAVAAALVVLTLGGGLLYCVQASAEAVAPLPTGPMAPAAKGDPSKGDDTLKSTLLTLEKAWIASDGRPDTDTYGKFLADDFVCFADDGTKSDKAQNLRAHMGYHMGADYKMSDVELIRLNEKAAILTYKIQYEVISNATGKAVAKHNLRYFSTWVHRGGGWLIVFTQSRELSP